VLLGDDIVDAEKPCLLQMIEVYEQYQTSILGVQQVERAHVDKYGIIDGVQLVDRLYRVNGLVEKPSAEDAPSDVAVLGRYIINPAIFDILENIQPGKGGEIQLTDALQVLAQREIMYSYHFQGRRYDVGDKQGFLEATVEFALKREELRGDFLAYLLKVVEREKAGV